MEKIGQAIFVHVAGELNLRIAGALLPHRFHVAPGLGMIASGDDQLHIGKLFRHQLEGFDHQLQPFVSSPLAEGEDAAPRIAAPGKVGIFGTEGENAMRAHMHIVAAILVAEKCTVPRHEHRNGIGKQKHPGGDGACGAVGAREANACVLEIDSIHQVVQRDVSVAAAKTGQQRRHEPGKRD